MTSSAVEKSPAWPATPPIAEQFGSWTSPQTIRSRQAQFSVAELSRMLWRGGDPDAAIDGPSDELDSAFEMTQEPSGGVVIGASSGRRPRIDLHALRATVMTRAVGVSSSFRAEPLRLLPTVDQRTRTVGVVVRVENARGEGDLSWVNRQHLRSGAFCEVVVESPEPTPTLLLPRSAVQDGSVMVVGPDDRLERREVRVGPAVGDSIAVLAGLSAGEAVAVRHAGQPMVGELVRPIRDRVARVASGPPEAAEGAAL